MVPTEPHSSFRGTFRDTFNPTQILVFTRERLWIFLDPAVENSAIATIYLGPRLRSHLFQYHLVFTRYLAEDVARKNDG